MTKKKKTEKPKVHEDLKGFNIQVNSFGEVISNIDIDKINDFLNENVEDKKLTDREDDSEESTEK